MSRDYPRRHLPDGTFDPHYSANLGRGLVDSRNTKPAEKIAFFEYAGAPVVRQNFHAPEIPESPTRATTFSLLVK
jgi:hypothetical protein